MTHLFCFGMGYCAKVLAKRLAANGWQISGTSRTAQGAAVISKLGYEGLIFNGDTAGSGLVDTLKTASHVLMSAAPDDAGDPILRCHWDNLAAADSIKWLGYLSTVGVYGDFQGAWVDETAELLPASARGKRRVAAEKQWLDFGATTDTAIHIFRLAGIYGPGSSPLAKLQAGTAKRIVKPDQVFNRIHVEDIAGALIASMAKPNPGAIYNVVDDEPAPPQDVVTYAAKLLGIEPPPIIDFNQADMSPMARSFYGENKRVSNARLKSELEYELQFKTFREGLQSLVEN